MKLFHFTSDFHVKDCTNAGIFMGVIPMSMNFKTGDVEFEKGYQWITSNPDYDQSWNRKNSLPYDRTMYRLTIEIPEMFEKNIMKFDTDLKKMIPAEMYGILAGDDQMDYDPENWYVYHGVILSSWIKKVERKPDNFDDIGACDGCQYFGIDGGPGPVMCCGHQLAPKSGYIISWKDGGMGERHRTPEKGCCPLKTRQRN